MVPRRLTKKRGHDGSNGLHGLAELQAELAQAWRTAESNVRVGRDLKRRQATSDDEQGAAETAEGPVDSGRPKHQSTDLYDS